MRVVKDLISGNVAPVPIDIWYNGTMDTDSVTKRYAGSLCKLTDWDSTHGAYVTFAGNTTAMENVCGILEEEQPTSGNYLPDTTTYSVTSRKMTPIFPSSVIEAEYSQTDAAGTTNLLTNVTGTAAAASIACSPTTADYLIGGWVYCTNGACEGFLTYILDNTTGAITTDDVLPGAIVAADDLVIVQPPLWHYFDFDATYTGLYSLVTTGANRVQGLSTWISAPGIPKQKLDRVKHSGLIIKGARFYHQFIIPNNATYPNLWIGGMLES